MHRSRMSYYGVASFGDLSDDPTSWLFVVGILAPVAAFVFAGRGR